MSIGCFGLLKVWGLKVRLCGGKGIDVISQTDPYILVKFGDRVDRTEGCEKGGLEEMAWSDEFWYELGTGGEVVFLELWDSECRGVVKIPLFGVVRRERVVKEFRLSDEGGEVGTIEVGFEFKRNPRVEPEII